MAGREAPLSGKISKVDKNFAEISIPGHFRPARLDRAQFGRLLGCLIRVLEDVLEPLAVKVQLEPITSDKLSRLPPQVRRKILQTYDMEVRWMELDVLAIPQPPRFASPSSYFDYDMCALGAAGIPKQYVARIVAGLMQITRTLNCISLRKLFPFFRTHFNVKDIPDIEKYIGDQRKLQRFVESQPQYFQVYSEQVIRYEGFPEDEVKAVITEKCEEMQGVDGTKYGHDATSQRDYVIRNTQIIETVGDTKAALQPILDSTQSGMQTVVGLDCEGVNLGAISGSLTLVQISTESGKVFLFDVFKAPQLLEGTSCLKKLLEHQNIIKVIHDCKSDASALYRNFNVNLGNVFDTSIATRALMDQLSMGRSFRIGFKALCTLLDQEVFHKEDEFKTKMLSTPDFWKIRPLTEEMIFYGAADVLYLVPSFHQKLKRMLTPRWLDFVTWSCADTLAIKQKPAKTR